MASEHVSCGKRGPYAGQRGMFYTVCHGMMLHKTALAAINYLPVNVLSLHTGSGVALSKSLRDAQ